MNIGLIGASRVATYAIIEPVRELDDVRVVAIAARDQQRADAYAATHGIDRAWGNYADLCADPRIDLIYVGTPPALHAAQALAAIAAGKHVLVEKPFTLSSAEARRVLDAARAAGVHVFEAMHSPHHRMFQRLLALVATDAVGTVHRLDARFSAPVRTGDAEFRWNAELGGGALMDLGVYPLCWVRRIAGESFTVEHAAARFHNDVDVEFSASLRFSDGIVASVEASMEGATFDPHLTITGSDGTITARNPLSPQRGHAIEIDSRADHTTETVDGPSSFLQQLMAVRATVVDGAPFPAAPDDALNSMIAIERVRARFGP
jgi:predicted dehydrogenase